MAYILTGHGTLNSFLWERGLADSARCVCEEDDEDWEHVCVDVVCMSVLES